MIIQNPLIGSARKKLGGSVASKWNGLNVLKSKPLTVANPRTTGQVLQRSKLSVFSMLIRLLAPLVNVGWASAKPTGQSARSAAMKASYPELIFSGGGDVIDNPEAQKVSQGALVPTAITAALVSSTLTVTWDGMVIPGSNQTSSDQLYGAIIGTNIAYDSQPVAVLSLGTISRNAGTWAADVSDLQALGATEFAIYTFFKSTGSPALISDSVSVTES